MMAWALGDKLSNLVRFMTNNRNAAQLDHVVIIGDAPDTELEQHRGRKVGGVYFVAVDGVGRLIDGQKDGDGAELFQDR